jgi:hypothetical protein
VLQAGDLAPVGSGVAGTPDAELPENLRPRIDGHIELRVMVGLASYRLVPESLEVFLSTSWTVTPDANRVGYRFRGEPLAFVDREPPPGAGNDPSNVVDFGYLRPDAIIEAAVSTCAGACTLGTASSPRCQRCRGRARRPACASSARRPTSWRPSATR